MEKLISTGLILLLSACQRVEPPPQTIKLGQASFEVNGDTVMIEPNLWRLDGLGDYPFTIGGDLACSNGSVEFYPNGLNEQDIGQPLNQTAQDSFRKSNLTPNVPNSIKPNADLSQAVKLGLIICDFNNKQMKQATK